MPKISLYGRNCLHFVLLFPRICCYFSSSSSVPLLTKIQDFNFNVKLRLHEEFLCDNFLFTCVDEENSVTNEIAKTAAALSINKKERKEKVLTRGLTLSLLVKDKINL